jgi:hypothetical protein
MISGSVPGAVKPITNVATAGLPSDWLRAGDSHDVQSSSTKETHQQDEYPTATEPLFTCRLTEESIPVGYILK